MFIIIFKIILNSHYGFKAVIIDYIVNDQLAHGNVRLGFVHRVQYINTVYIL